MSACDLDRSVTFCSQSNPRSASKFVAALGLGWTRHTEFYRNSNDILTRPTGALLRTQFFTDRISSHDCVAERKLKAVFGGKLFVLVHPTEHVLYPTFDTLSDQTRYQFRHPPGRSRSARGTGSSRM